MKTSHIILLVVVGIVVVLGLWLWWAYNGMVGQQESATTAFANVQATYQRRADLIPNLTRTVQAYAKHEKSTFTEVTKARASVSQIHLDASTATPEQIKKFDQAQGQLSQALGKLMLVAERYPELKANENFHDLQIQLEGTENRINEARQKYNETVQSYNLTIRRFPNVLIAGSLGFTPMQKFEASSSAQSAPTVNFDNDI